jgi:GAF domain-containing protein
MSSSAGDVARPYEGITQLAGIVVFDKPLGGTAQEVVDLARRSLNHCDGAGMQLLERHGLSARVSTDTRSSQFDALQDDLDDGPCVECLRTGAFHDLEPVTSDERWPSFAPSARRVGLVACLALPLIAGGDLIGTLNLYAWPLGGFAGWDREHCKTFAQHASLSLASAQAYARTQVLIADLRARLALPDDIIDQAYGVLMARGNTGLDEARTRLAARAAAERCALDVAAQSVLDSMR